MWLVGRPSRGPGLAKLRGQEGGCYSARAAQPRLAMPEQSTDHFRRQLEALLEVSEAIAQQRDLPALFHELAQRLHSVVDFDFLTLMLYDAARNSIRLHVLETREGN